MVAINRTRHRGDLPRNKRVKIEAASDSSPTLEIDEKYINLQLVWEMTTALQEAVHATSEETIAQPQPPQPMLEI